MATKGKAQLALVKRLIMATITKLIPYITNPHPKNMAIPKIMT
jgi:hypothetical protein